MKPVCVLVLTDGIWRRRKWIFPAEPVPVVDVLAEDNQVRPGDGLLLIPKFKQPGGQLERPSEVNSSSSTGTRTRSLSAAVHISGAANIASTAATELNNRITPQGMGAGKGCPQP
jgi:hypothetical protein